ncbi:hypothetical protein K458DRAFT_389321 [Lentithecium fluviatile CBS 122367]|uniref:Uncharacterized protein n=1 Tax=Lentithecium fluviatile CBS 122367 TaxID=1168545 RepID=A0A6G1J1E1_9PLEO|nr:hypothetical protein K458DRAFT_389321 [Lentithecium fluviatile CBS 122367]
MKLLQLLSVYALGALVGATSSAIDNRDVLDRPVEPKKGADCDICLSDLASCYLACPKRDQACASGCKPNICASGRSQCRKGGKCTDFNWNCPGAKAEAQTNPILARADQAECQSCRDWLAVCQRTKCARPWAPECQWQCQAEMCKVGPPECKAGTPCGRLGACRGQQGTEDVAATMDAPTSSPVLFPRNDQADCRNCQNYYSLCTRDMCSRMPAPECYQYCQAHMCKLGPGSCRRGTECGKACGREPELDTRSDAVGCPYCDNWQLTCTEKCVDNGGNPAACNARCISELCTTAPENCRSADCGLCQKTFVSQSSTLKTTSKPVASSTTRGPGVHTSVLDLRAEDLVSSSTTRGPGVHTANSTTTRGPGIHTSTFFTDDIVERVVASSTTGGPGVHTFVSNKNAERSTRDPGPHRSAKPAPTYSRTRD